MRITPSGSPCSHLTFTRNPDVGEINATYLFQLLDRLGYDGWIGCEYRPARGAAPHATSDGLGWLKPWL